MKIAGINCILPSNKISNTEILDLVKYYSNPLYEGDINKLREKVKNNLINSGIKSRYWRNTKEKPLDLIYESYIQNLKLSGVDPKEIDTIIYVSVDRGFIEPANACFIANKIGLSTIRNFDLVDACMGWCTATQISQSLFMSNQANTILIVSSECPMDKNGVVYPNNFKIKNNKELDWKFPAYTIGEAVTTTILQKSDKVWDYKFINDSRKADLCTIPLYKFSEYSDASDHIKNNKFSFSAYGRELYYAGFKNAIKVLKDKLDSCNCEPKLIIPHSVSSRVPNRVNEILNLDDKIFTTFSKIGNVATSSIPANIYFALLAGKIKKGDYIIGWIASGGLKYSAFDIHL